MLSLQNNFVKGVGIIPYRIHSKPSHLLAYDAAYSALEDSDLGMGDIDAVIVSNLEWFYSSEKQRHMASVLSSTFKTRIPIIKVPAACAGGGTAFWAVNRMMKEDKEWNNVLVIGVEKLMETTDNSAAIINEFMMAMESRWEQPEGINAPCSAALTAQEYMNRFPDTTMDDLALISFKNHSNGFNNPNAFFYKKKVTLEQIKKSPIASSPLRVHDCSISCDGAAACVITKDKTDIEIAGSDYCADNIIPFERDDPLTWEATLISSGNALKQAGITIKDIDIAELHDAFTIVELLSYEDLGFCKKGEAYKLVRDGFFGIDGKVPANVSGGLKAKGHPVSATGLGMIYELAKQLRNEAGDRQVSNLKYALMHNIGGIGNAIVCNILKKVGG